MSESLLDDTALEEENVHNVTKSDRKSVNCNEGASHDESLYNSEDCKESKESISFVHEKIDNDKVELNDKRGNPEEESVDLKSMSHGSRATDGAGDKNIEVEGEVMVPEVPITTAEGENLVREEKDMSEEKENVDTGRETMTTEGGEIGAEGGTYQCNDNAESTKKKRNRKNRFLNCFGSKSDSDHSDEDISSELIEKFKDDKESLFDYFWQSNSVFSQWYKIKFVVDDVEYNCAEQYMMHQKALLMEDGDNAEIVMALDDPQEQKSVGRLVENWNEELWLKHRLNIVKKGNIAKFSQNSELLQELISTFPKILVEASPYDKVWGIGLRAHDKRAHNRAYWKGENLLGYILTEVRDEIMREHGMMEDSTHLTKDSENAASQNISSPFQKTSDFECTPKTENDENTEDSLSVVTTNENISNTDDTQPVLLSPNDNGKYTEESKVMPMDVKEEHNQEAAFSFIMQLDGGMTIMPRAGRVHKEYEGTGLYKKLDDYTLALYSQNPDVRYKAIVFIDSNPTLTKKVEEGIYYATLYRKILTFRSTIAKLKADLENRTFCSNVERVDANQLIAIMENKTITGTLFPQNIFASSWTPLRTMKENCEHVFANSGIVLISNKNDEKEVKLTIGHPIRSSIGLSYVIDVYGLRHDDVLDHVLQHLDTVKDYEEDVLQLEVFIEDTDANIRCIHQMACELGFEKYDLAIKEMHCIEKKIG